MDKSGIYTITNLLDNKIYVGYATNFRKRKGDHISNLRKNKHKNIHLQRAFNRDGESNFKIELLEECSKENLIEREDFWCKKLNTHTDKFGYNLLGTGEKGLIQHSDETKQKMSNLKLGYKCSEEHCKNIGLAKKGISLSEEHKEKLKIKTYDANKRGIKKLNEGKVKEIVFLINQGIKTSVIAKQFNVDRHVISKIKYNKMWNFIDKGYIKQNKSKYSIKQINLVRQRLLEGKVIKEISLELNIPIGVIYKIKNRPNYGM